MSGICGFIGSANDFTNKALVGKELAHREQVLEAMKNRIKHRGPDGEGNYIDAHAALGFRRLAVIDLEQGHQPMVSKNGKFVITLNGEIYNYRELRDELKACGYSFTTNTDAEVLLAAWEHHGEALLNKLRGMFAFVIWDTRNMTAFGARDYFGVKPFYYTKLGDTLVYASEIKSILEYPGVEKELNREALEHYLSFQYSVLPETFFKGIFKLGPGECFTFKQGELQIRRYFDPLPAESFTSALFTDTVEQIKQVVAESVQAHMVSDVEVGSLLSSGIDSSYVTALYPNQHTYTVGFDTPDGVKYNEISFAQQAAEEMGKLNTSRVISPQEYWDAVPQVMYHMDEPLGDPSAVALYFLGELVAKDVKVVLSGEGADEFFGGYPLYHEPLGLAGFQKLPRWLRCCLAATARTVPFKFKGKSFLERAAKTVETRYASNANNYQFSVAQREALLKEPLFAPPPEALTRYAYSKVAHLPDTHKMRYIDYNFWQPGDILLKGDKMMMAHSLESRMPFLDAQVFSLANTLPLEYLVNNQTTKVALRAAASEVLPERIATRPKLGFPVPMRVWLKEDCWYQCVREVFVSKDAKEFFNTELLLELLEAHRDDKADNSRKIWNVYVFLVWYRVFFG